MEVMQGNILFQYLEYNIYLTCVYREFIISMFLIAYW